MPKSLEQFRIWSDDNLNLKPIGSKGTLYQAWNRDRRIEILNLIKLLRLPKETLKQRKSSSDRLKAENRELKHTLRQLAGEMHKTRQELQGAQRENSRKDQRIKDLLEEKSELIAQLKNRTGLYPVK